MKVELRPNFQLVVTFDDVEELGNFLGALSEGTYGCAYTLKNDSKLDDASRQLVVSARQRLWDFANGIAESSQKLDGLRVPVRPNLKLV
jgi:hypothetical protein